MRSMVINVIMWRNVILSTEKWPSFLFLNPKTSCVLTEGM